MIMGKLFKIEGYWKDTDEYLLDALVYENDEHPDWLDDDDIFYYGLSADDLEKLIKLGENTAEEFVVTDYEEIDCNDIPEKTISDIIDMVRENPNDFDLGSKIRKYINEFIYE